MLSYLWLLFVDPIKALPLVRVNVARPCMLCTERDVCSHPLLTLWELLFGTRSYAKQRNLADHSLRNRTGMHCEDQAIYIMVAPRLSHQLELVTPFSQCYKPPFTGSYPQPSTDTDTGLKAWYWLDLASILPPLLLDVQPGHSVLDMCAAPGRFVHAMPVAC